MLGKTDNQLLMQTEQAIEQKIPPNLKEPFSRVIAAGMTIMYTESSNKFMVEQLTKQGNPLQNVGEGAAMLVGTLMRQSGGKMPTALAVPAAIIFMCEGLDFLEAEKGLQITPDVIADATQETAAYVLQMMGVPQDKLNRLLAAQEKKSQTPQPAPKRGIIASAIGGM